VLISEGVFTAILLEQAAIKDKSFIYGTMKYRGFKRGPAWVFIVTGI